MACDATPDAGAVVGHDYLALVGSWPCHDTDHGVPPALEPVQRVPDEYAQEVLETLRAHLDAQKRGSPHHDLHRDPCCFEQWPEEFADSSQLHRDIDRPAAAAELRMHGNDGL